MARRRLRGSCRARRWLDINPSTTRCTALDATPSLSTRHSLSLLLSTKLGDAGGDTHARRRYARPGGVGMGGGRAAAAVPPSPALTSPSCFSSNQPVSLRGRRGWECSRAACTSARGARSLSRGHGGSGEYLARSHYFTLYQALPLCPDCLCRTASGGGRTKVD